MFTTPVHVAQAPPQTALALVDADDDDETTRPRQHIHIKYARQTKLNKQHLAAMKIQRRFRGFRIRKRNASKSPMHSDAATECLRAYGVYRRPQERVLRVLQALRRGRFEYFEFEEFLAFYEAARPPSRAPPNPSALPTKPPHMRDG